MNTIPKLKSRLKCPHCSKFAVEIVGHDKDGEEIFECLTCGWSTHDPNDSKEAAEKEAAEKEAAEKEAAEKEAAEKEAAEDPA